MNQNLAIYGGKPVRNSYLPYGYHWINDDDIQAVTDVLRNDLITQGPKVPEFEKAMARYCSVKYATAFSSGTAALHGAAYAAGITTGYEAITTPLTFAADGNCVLHMDGKIIFADIQKDTYNIDPNKIRERVSQNTKVIIAVDFAGQPCDIDEINHITRDNNIIFIQDAAHSLGSKYKGKNIGGLADLTILSFHPVKAITTGEGGMVLTNKKEFFEKLQLFRTHGITKDPKNLSKKSGAWYYEMQSLGLNYRITDFQCALGLSQLRRINQFIKKRRKIVKIYNDEFSDIPEIITPIEKKNVISAFHLYVIQLNLKNLITDRRTIFDALRAENIGVHVHYIPLHLHPFYRWNFGYKTGDFPVSEYFYEHAITLPLFPRMSDKDISDVILAVKKVIGHYRK